MDTEPDVIDETIAEEAERDIDIQDSERFEASNDNEYGNESFESGTIESLVIADPILQAVLDQKGGEASDWEHTNGGDGVWVFDGKDIFNPATGEKYFDNTDPDASLTQETAARQWNEGGNNVVPIPGYEEETPEHRLILAYNLILGDKREDGTFNVSWTEHKHEVIYQKEDPTPAPIDVREYNYEPYAVTWDEVFDTLLVANENIENAAAMTVAAAVEQSSQEQIDEVERFYFTVPPPPPEETYFFVTPEMSVASASDPESEQSDEPRAVDSPLETMLQALLFEESTPQPEATHIMTERAPVASVATESAPAPYQEVPIFVAANEHEAPAPMVTGSIPEPIAALPSPEVALPLVDISTPLDTVIVAMNQEHSTNLTVENTAIESTVAETVDAPQTPAPEAPPLPAPPFETIRIEVAETVEVTTQVEMSASQPAIEPQQLPEHVAERHESEAVIEKIEAVQENATLSEAAPPSIEEITMTIMPTAEKPEVAPSPLPRELELNLSGMDREDKESFRQEREYAEAIPTVVDKDGSRTENAPAEIETLSRNHFPSMRFFSASRSRSVRSSNLNGIRMEQLAA